MEIENELKTAIQTGSVVVGSRKSIKNLRSGAGKLVFIARNCPQRYLNEVSAVSKEKNVPMRVLDYTSIELGAFCRKPYSVAVMVVNDAGSSEILNISRENKVEPKA